MNLTKPRLRQLGSNIWRGRHHPCPHAPNRVAKLQQGYSHCIRQALSELLAEVQAQVFQKARLLAVMLAHFQKPRAGAAVRKDLVKAIDHDLIGRAKAVEEGFFEGDED